MDVTFGARSRNFGCVLRLSGAITDPESKKRPISRGLKTSLLWLYWGKVANMTSKLSPCSYRPLFQMDAILQEAKITNRQQK